jgi:asparagine synthase (glutamine-hydrolysing)
MCGVAGFLALDNGRPVANADAILRAMSTLLAHRGPDGEGFWIAPDRRCGFAHRRLSIVDLTPGGAQPMTGPDGAVVTYNGEIYNHVELRRELADTRTFRSASDTEVLLAANERWGQECLDRLRGMFAFAIWDPRTQTLFAARDRFGIKPLYYTVVDRILYFASETKALLPFLPSIETCAEALSEYFVFQYTLSDQTLFEGIRALPPGHALTVRNGEIAIRRYWDVQYQVERGRPAGHFVERFRTLFSDSLALHLRADVPVGAYVSGGLDSSLIATVAARQTPGARRLGFHGRFAEFPGYDESDYAATASEAAAIDLHTVDISASDFRDRIEDVVYHLDFPAAGPGAFPQFMVSALAAQHVKAVLGGQGGDELLGGYARYLLAYFEQCIKSAIDGTYQNGNYVVTIESIVPNLGVLDGYRPLMQEFWREGLFDELDRRYFRLIDRSTDMAGEVDPSLLDKTAAFEKFRAIFDNANNVRKEAYFDKMTHFDFKCLLPALLQVEDRMSMAHGLESRVPFLDHQLVEFLATVPADVKFKGGQGKQIVKSAYRDTIPPAVLNRRDKMGFPVPLKEWFEGPLRDFVADTLSDPRARTRGYVDTSAALKNADRVGRYSRKLWGLLALELWQKRFHDRAAEFRAMIA